jgi:hypothetical protein
MTPEQYTIPTRRRFRFGPAGLILSATPWLMVMLMLILRPS